MWQPQLQLRNTVAGSRLSLSAAGFIASNIVYHKRAMSTAKDHPSIVLCFFIILRARLLGHCTAE